MKYLIATLLVFLTASVTAEQICDSSLATTTSITRFIDNGDGSVTDSATGLVWKKCVEGVSGDACEAGQNLIFTWQGALQRAVSENSVTALGYNDWRLPNVKELATLVELQCHSPAINLFIFPNQPVEIEVNSSLTWTSSPSTETPFAWGVQFIEGEVAQANKNNTGFVRLVRN